MLSDLRRQLYVTGGYNKPKAKYTFKIQQKQKKNNERYCRQFHETHNDRSVFPSSNTSVGFVLFSSQKKKRRKKKTQTQVSKPTEIEEIDEMIANPHVLRTNAENATKVRSDISLSLHF